MHAAYNGGITILGATILRISGLDNHGEPVETRQMTYVTDNSNKLFLSREACVALGIITDSFPSVGTCSENMIAADSLKETQNCQYPTRQLPPPLPTTLPFAATDNNRLKLHNFLLNHYRSSTFNTCEHQALPLMRGPPMRLMVEPDAKPVAHHLPVPVPIHWQEEVKAGLDQDVRLGVIEPVPIGEPVTWCHRMVICVKKNGKPRRTVDFQPLSVHATRETHHTPSPFHQARLVPHGTKKSVLHTWNGYYSVPIHPDDRHITTFLHLGAGIDMRPPHKDTLRQVTATPDDTMRSLLTSKTRLNALMMFCFGSIPSRTAFFQVAQWLDICGRNGITLNPEKVLFAQDTVDFTGFEISPNSVRPCAKYFNAIMDFPTPQNITDVRSWIGLVNQVSYAFSMAEKMNPFRQLLKHNAPFEWTTELENLFQISKN